MAELGSSLPQIAPFLPDADPTSVAQRWKRWSERFDNFLIALDITDNKRKRGLLLHLAGECVYDIFQGLVIADPDADPVVDAYLAAKRALDEHFSPKKNVEFERYTFHATRQSMNENIDMFHARLRSLSKYCEFPDIDAAIKSQIIQTCRSTRLRRRALTDTSMTLQAVVDLGRSLEISELQTRTIEGKSTEADNEAIAQIRRQRPIIGTRTPHVQQKVNTICRNCGDNYPHPAGKPSCPAYGTQCRGCHGYNHWKRCCRKTSGRSTIQYQVRDRSFSSRGRSQGRGQTHRPPQQVRLVDNEESSHHSQEYDDDDHSDCEDQYAFTLINDHMKQPSIVISIQGTSVKFIIDSGSSCNIMDQASFLQLEIQPKLTLSKSKLFTYGSKEPMHIIGKFSAVIEANNKCTTATFHVTHGTNGCLLSYQTASDLNLMTLNVNSVNDNDIITVAEIGKRFPTLFSGIGKLEDFQAKLHIDESVVPVAQPHRRTPFHIRKKIDKEIIQMLKQGIIEPIEGPTPWVSNIVTPPKPNNPDEIRICLDARWPNKAIQRTRYVTPTLDDIAYTLNYAKVFSKLDLKAAYNQLELHPDSRYITCFSAGELG